MSRLSRLRNRLQSWRKLLGQNWTLFKASKIGLIGLAIMISFVIIAIAAPFMGLRDPLWWRAPDQDIVKVTKFWPLAENNSRNFGNSPINHTIAVRIAPAANELRTDRIYVAAGTKLYAIDPTHGTSAWSNPATVDFEMTGDSNPIICSDPVVVNYGDHVRGSGTFWIYVATQSGYVYAMNDSLTGRQPAPAAVRIGLMDGPATSLAVFSGDSFPGFTAYDMVAAASTKGTLYLWRVNSTGHNLTSTITISTEPVRIASSPMRGSTGYPMFSPAFYYAPSNFTRPWLYVSSEDGKLSAVDISDLNAPRIAWSNRIVTSGVPWTTAPVVHYVSNPPITSTVVFAATDDSNVTAIYARNGSYLPHWGGVRRVGTTLLKPDIGRFTQPYLEPGSTTMFIGSSSGYLYSINYITPAASATPLSVNWFYVDATKPPGSTYISSTPNSYGGILLFFASNYDLGPKGPSPEDTGTVFALNINSGAPSWSVEFKSWVSSSMIAADGQQTVQPELFIGTDEGSEYAFATTGLYLIPGPPSWVSAYPSGNMYVLGLDNRGRDIFSQWVWGSRIALYVGFLSAAFSISIGTTMGLVAGYFGGKIDNLLMRFTDVILVIPSLPLIITLAAVLGSSVNNLILVIAIVGWPGVARVIRSQVLSLKERPFIESAKVTGASHARIMARHILPNVLPLAFLYMTFAVSGAILSEAALSFIGLGDINTVSWGRMLQDVSQSQTLKAWWWLLPPGIAITLISLGFFLIGRAFDEIVNPRLRKR